MGVAKKGQWGAAALLEIRRKYNEFTYSFSSNGGTISETQQNRL